MLYGERYDVFFNFDVCWEWPILYLPISSDPSLQSTAVAIPGGEGGIGFDDLVFSPELHKVLVPAGHTGKLYLIDPTTFAMTSIGGFCFERCDCKKGMR